MHQHRAKRFRYWFHVCLISDVWPLWRFVKPNLSGRVVYSAVLTACGTESRGFEPWTSTNVCGSKRLGCYAELYTVSRCCTRGESEDHSSEKAHKGSTLALKPMRDVTRGPTQRYQWPHKKTYKKIDLWFVSLFVASIDYRRRQHFQWRHKEFCDAASRRHYLRDAALDEATCGVQHVLWWRPLCVQPHQRQALWHGVVPVRVGALTVPPTPNVHPPVSTYQEAVPDVIPTWKETQDKGAILSGEIVLVIGWGQNPRESPAQLIIEVSLFSARISLLAQRPQPYRFVPIALVLGVFQLHMMVVVTKIQFRFLIKFAP